VEIEIVEFLLNNFQFLLFRSLFFLSRGLSTLLFDLFSLSLFLLFLR